MSNNEMTKHWFAADSYFLSLLGDGQLSSSTRSKHRSRCPGYAEVSPSTEDDDNSLSLMADSQ
jgi:hypothetical protein